jgi:hypothetical protein
MADRPRQRRHMGAGIAIGLALGVAVGVALDNLPVGIAIGIALGAAIGASWERQRTGKDGPDENDGAAGAQGP